MKWPGYDIRDNTSVPVRAFVPEEGHVNKLFAKFCPDHQPKYNTTLKCRELSKRLFRKVHQPPAPVEDSALLQTAVVGKDVRKTGNKPRGRTAVDAKVAETKLLKRGT